MYVYWMYIQNQNINIFKSIILLLTFQEQYVKMRIYKNEGGSNPAELFAMWVAVVI
jgi:hypothetical protein